MCRNKGLPPQIPTTSSERSRHAATEIQAWWACDLKQSGPSLQGNGSCQVRLVEGSIILEGGQWVGTPNLLAQSRWLSASVAVWGGPRSGIESMVESFLRPYVVPVCDGCRIHRRVGRQGQAVQAGRQVAGGITQDPGGTPSPQPQAM